MRGVVLLTLYLMRDTVARWIEQPAGVIAKGSVVGFMVATAMAILASFALAADELERRLGDIGLDRFYVREAILQSTRKPGEPTVGEMLEQSNVFGPEVRVVRLRAAPVRVTSEFGQTLPAYLYDADAPPLETQRSDANGLVLCLPGVPEGVSVEVHVDRPAADRVTAVATTAPPPEWSASIDPSGLVLVPDGLGLLGARNVVSQLVIVERGPNSPSLEEMTTAVMRLARAERIDVTVQGPGPIIRSLDELRSRRDLVRGGLAVIFGAGAAFVFAAMGVLEYREVRYVGALLRSFGAAPWSLFARHAIEQLLIANLGLITALSLMWYTRAHTVAALGYPVGPSQESVLASIVAPEVEVIAMIMNGGVMVGLLPVAWLIAKPVGRVLS